MVTPPTARCSRYAEEPPPERELMAGVLWFLVLPQLTTENREVTGSTPVGATGPFLGFYWEGAFFVKRSDSLSVSAGVSHLEKPQHTTHAAVRRLRSRARASTR